MRLQISRILHAGYVFECAGVHIAFDTIFENPFSRNCHAFPDVRFDYAQISALRYDAVFISHFHDDHCSLESLDLLDRSTPLYLYCLFEELFAMVRALGFVNVHALKVNAPVNIGPFEIIPREALDADVDSMFQIKAAGLNILNVVDAWIDPETLPELVRYAPWDMILWPFQTMREIDVLSPSRATPAAPQLPDDWIEQLRLLKPRYVVPSSCQFLQETWSWYNHAFFPITYLQFQHEIEAALPGTKVVRLNPSVSVTLDATTLHPAAPLSWVIPVGPQDVDYQFHADTIAPPTALIATRFAALTHAQHTMVTEFCCDGLLTKYRDMELEPDSYFSVPRVWRLSVYDHAGHGCDYHYLIDGDNIAPLAGAREPLAWTTEIPAAKLYAALALGESLTSMYMRINDVAFGAEVEQDLTSAEIVDDPLIRCLFNESFGAYQAAQLQRLQARQ